MSDVLSITPANDEKGKEGPKYRLKLVPKTENKIIVRECYKPLYEYIRNLRNDKYTGLVLTGQPRNWCVFIVTARYVILTLISTTRKDHCGYRTRLFAFSWRTKHLPTIRVAQSTYLLATYWPT
jgi:hypothetical protein